MASVYCQELIRNTQILCESYIGEILIRGDKQKESAQGKEKDEIETKDEIQAQLGDNYYLEDDKRLLDVMIKNCHPILTDLVSQVNNFNKYNTLNVKPGRVEMTSEFDQDLQELLETKKQFEITGEAKENLKRFADYKAVQESSGAKLAHVPSKGALMQELEGGRPSDLSKPLKSARRAKQQEFQRQFVDEMAP